ncbi:MAG: type II toxin-antitoxin system YafQ family toxin [Opitutae bacterium]|nr:type II toxin-antitoxin system YafQ family toxin [Opitutae bacterium]
MTRQLVRTSQFKRDNRKRVLSPKVKAAVIDGPDRLLSGTPFELHHRDHPLQGSWSGVRDRQVQPDLLLLYEIKGELAILRRLGTHSDIFG